LRTALIPATATAVSRIDNLEFLADVIPKTTTYRQFKEKRAKEAAKDTVMEKGQRKLSRNKPAENGTHRSSGIHPVSQTKNNRGSGQPHGAQLTITSFASASHSTMIADRTINDSAGRNGGLHNEDVEMTG
jgi:DNA-directed RNA polymerase I subunit RPA43